MRRRLAALVVLGLGGAAHADDLIYVEALGKGGAYGVGYEHSLTPRLSLGIAASFVSVSGQHVYTAAPYLHATVVGSTHHALFTELGAVLAHSRIPSPVDDWDGMTDTGGGGFLSVGYEYRRGHIVLRASGAVVAGEGGLGPMLGLALGVKP
jgi:hypothetical protein